MRLGSGSANCMSFHPSVHGLEIETDLGQEGQTHAVGHQLHESSTSSRRRTYRRYRRGARGRTPMPDPSSNGLPRAAAAGRCGQVGRRLDPTMESSRSGGRASRKRSSRSLMVSISGGDRPGAREGAGRDCRSMQLRGELLGVGFAQVQLELRGELLEARQQRRQHIRRDRRYDPEARGPDNRLAAVVREVGLISRTSERMRAPAARSRDPRPSGWRLLGRRSMSWTSLRSSSLLDLHRQGRLGHRAMLLPLCRSGRTADRLEVSQLFRRMHGHQFLLSDVI